MILIESIIILLDKSKDVFVSGSLDNSEIAQHLFLDIREEVLHILIMF